MDTVLFILIRYFNNTGKLNTGKVNCFSIHLFMCNELRKIAPQGQPVLRSSDIRLNSM